MGIELTGSHARDCESGGSARQFPDAASGIECMC